MGSLPFHFLNDVVSFRWSRHRQLHQKQCWIKLLLSTSALFIELLVFILERWSKFPEWPQSCPYEFLSFYVDLRIILYPALMFEFCSTLHTNKSTNMPLKRGRSTKMWGQTAMDLRKDPWIRSLILRTCLFLRMLQSQCSHLRQIQWQQLLSMKIFTTSSTSTTWDRDCLYLAVWHSEAF